MKKILFTLIIFAGLFVFLQVVNAQGGGTVEFKNPLSVTSVEELVVNVLGFLQKIIALIAILMIVVAGIGYMVSFGNEQSMEKAKKMLVAAVVGLALVLAAPSFVKEILAILKTNSLNPGDINKALTIQQILLNILKFLLSFAGILAVVNMVLGGQKYMTSGGDEEAMKNGKKTFIYSLIGVIIVAGSLVLVKVAVDMFK